MTLKHHPHFLLRQAHRWLALLIAAPLFIIICTGVTLMLRPYISVIQPLNQKGSGPTPTLSFEQIINIAQSQSEAAVNSWADIKQIDLRPDQGTIKVRTKNDWELQIDAQNGKVLSSAKRYTSLIISIHEGTFFSKNIKTYVFLPTGIVLLILWFTGLLLFFRPLWSKSLRKALSLKKFSIPTAIKEDAHVKATVSGY